MVLSQLFNFRRNSRGRWYCPELIAYALGLSMPHAKSPGDLLRAIRDHVTTLDNAQALLRLIVLDDEAEMGGALG